MSIDEPIIEVRVKDVLDGLRNDIQALHHQVSNAQATANLTAPVLTSLKADISRVENDVREIKRALQSDISEVKSSLQWGQRTLLGLIGTLFTGFGLWFVTSQL